MKALVLVSILDLSGQKKERANSGSLSSKVPPRTLHDVFIAFLQSANDLWRSGVLSTQVSNEKDLGCLKVYFDDKRLPSYVGIKVNHGFGSHP